MAFKSPGADLLPGYDGSLVKVQVAAAATAAGNTNVVLPATGNFAIPVYAGMVRVKTVTIGENASIGVLGIIGRDSTNALNFVQISGGDGSATTNGMGIDQCYLFRTDLSFSTINVVISVSNNDCTHDVEIAANPPRAVGP